MTSPLAELVTYGGETLTDRSATIAGVGALMAANNYRRGFFIQNINATTDLWVNFLGGTAAAGTPGSIRLGPYDAYESPLGGASLAAVSVSGAPAGHIITAWEY